MEGKNVNAILISVSETESCPRNVKLYLFKTINNNDTRLTRDKQTLGKCLLSFFQHDNVEYSDI